MKSMIKVRAHTQRNCVTKVLCRPKRLPECLHVHEADTAAPQHNAVDTTRRQLAATPRRRSLEVANLLERYYRSGGFPELRRDAAAAQGATEADRGTSTVTGRASIVPSPRAGGGILEDPWKLRRMAANNEWEIWVSAAVCLWGGGRGGPDTADDRPTTGAAPWSSPRRLTRCLTRR